MMKSLGTVLLAVGLVSAVTVSPGVQTSVQAAPAVEEGQNVTVGQSSDNGQAQSIGSIFNSSASLNGSQVSVADPSFDPANFNLSDLGVNVGQIDFSDPNSVASVILSMLNVLCIGNLFDVNTIVNLGVNNELQMFLELAQLMQLEQLGFLNVLDVQELLGVGFVPSVSSAVFDIGVFKRAVDERKKVMKRTRLRRTPTRTRTKRQCQANVVDPNAAATLDPAVAAPPASVTSDVVAPPAAATESAATESAPAAAPPAAAPPAAAPTDDSEPVSDFTR